MSDYITNFLVTLVAVLALLISAIGLSSVHSTNAKADNVKIEKQMEELETLFNELYNFHQSPNFHENGFSSLGEGKWSDAVLRLDKDKKLREYIKTLAPDPIEFSYPFQSLDALRPLHLWNTGRVYARSGGEENKDTKIVKSNFYKLFELHKSRKK